MFSGKGKSISIAFHSLLDTVIVKCAFLLLFVLVTSVASYAQTKTGDSTVPVKINHSKNLYHVQTDSGEFTKFIDNVELQQGTDILNCDSAYMNKTTRNFEAFGDVKITQEGGTEATSNYLKYTAASKTAFMKGNVSLTDGKSHLWCDELTYNLTTKTGVYDKGGRLESDSTTVTSKSGEYNVRSKEASFIGDAVITDPHYKIRSEHLKYNTETKVTRFFAPSVVTSDKMILHTSRGTYDSKNGLADFGGHSSIWNDNQYIEGDTLNYNKQTGRGYADGHVISIDTAHHSTIYCRHAEYHKKRRTLLAIGNPVLEQVNGKDTIYMYADTFYSAPIMKVKTIILINDTSKSAATQIKKHNRKHTATVVAPPVPEADTTVADTTAPLYFIGYHHVLIFSDSLQGKCDSVVYTQNDSMIRMIYTPIAWSHNSQITGDTIILKLDSSNLKSIYVPNNAFVVSLAGPPKAKLYDQVQGRMLKGFFKNNNIDNMLVCPNAQAIYYTKDAKGAFVGVNQSKTDSMRIFFNNKNIKQIKLNKENQETLTPLQKADLPSMKLSRFKWLIEQRPKSKEELFKKQEKE